MIRAYRSPQERIVNRLCHLAARIYRPVEHCVGVLDVEMKNDRRAAQRVGRLRSPVWILVTEHQGRIANSHFRVERAPSIGPRHPRDRFTAEYLGIKLHCLNHMAREMLKKKKKEQNTMNSCSCS